MRRRIARVLIVATAVVGAGAFALLWRERPWRFGLLFRDPIRLPRTSGLETRHLIRGLSEGDELGHAVAAAGDVNGDGRADFLIGAPYHDVQAEADGHVLLYSGQDGTVLQAWSGEAAGWNLGCAVAGGRDVDADGTPDVIAGFEKEGSASPGGARVFSGGTGEALFTFHGDTPRDLFGHAVAVVRDVDGDEHADILVGAPGTWRESTAGYARLFSGKTGRVLRTLHGESRVGDRFGFAVADAGDVDGDGGPDLAVGALGDAPNGPHSGRVYVFSGKDGRRLRTFDGDAAWHELGHALAGAGDVDGDGRSDLFAGAFLQKGMGYARLYSGRSGEILLEVEGREIGDAFGHSVGAGGDANGDGVPDLVVGAPDATVEGVDRVGFIRIYSGADGRLLLHRDGDRELMHFGYVVAFVGDVNGDFLDDVVAGTTVIQDVGEAHVSSACAVDPVRVQGGLTLARTRAGFEVSGGPADAAGALVLAGREEKTFTLDSGGRTTVKLKISSPRLSGRDAEIFARVRTATGTIASPKMAVRFCP